MIHPLSPRHETDEHVLSRCYDLGFAAGERDALHFVDVCPTAYEPPVGLITEGHAMELRVRFPAPREPKREEAFVRGYENGWRAYYTTG